MNRAKDRQVLHSKFVLFRKRDHTVTVKKYKARFVVCGNEEHEYDDECFSPVPDISTKKLIICFVKQRKWHVRHVDFQKAFPNVLLERPIYIEPRKSV